METIYLGDIDPNNNILPAINIRRMIMFQLLIWDKIVLSDSQFITDPRLNILMGKYNSTEVSDKYGVADINDNQKGIETLFENGLIDVAFRSFNNQKSSLLDTWTKMSKSPHPVPYLPQDENYVKHISNINFGVETYDISNMGNLFRENLITGVESDQPDSKIILLDNSVEGELKEQFYVKQPLFRDILDYLKAKKQTGELSESRYNELYDYVYACYNINVSKSIKGCHINTKFAHIPFHIESGEEFTDNYNPTQQQLERLRPTWAINPVFFDYLSFEDLVEIRKNLRIKEIRQFYLGESEEPWAVIEDAWDYYTDYLETKIRLILTQKDNKIAQRIFKEYGNEKFITKPNQQTILAPAFEIVKSCVSFIPIISEVIGVTDAAKSVFGSVVALSKRKERIKMANEHKNISQLISNETRVVTKYNKKDN